MTFWFNPIDIAYSLCYNLFRRLVWRRRLCGAIFLETCMIFGKHINKYYLKYSWLLILGIVALITVDYLQLEIPELYNYVVNGLTYGQVETPEGVVPFNMDFLLDTICFPMIFIIIAMVIGRFLWRICFLFLLCLHL